MNKYAQPTAHTITLPDPAGHHCLAYYEWGDPANEHVLLCVPGLTRNGRDFDFLAAALKDEYRILAVDLIGRGKSEWMKDPTLYTIEQYIHDILGLLHHLHIKQVDYLGVSLGGILGMLIAAHPHSPIKKLILDDIGPEIKQSAVEKLSNDVGANPTFATLGDLKTFLKSVYAETGQLEPYHWDHLLAHDHIRLPEGGYARAYDPLLFKSFAPMLAEDISLWPTFEAIRAPIYELHGEKSAILTPDICTRMLSIQPTLTMVTLPGIAHAPSLMDSRHIAQVASWLLDTK